MNNLLQKNFKVGDWVVIEGIKYRIDIILNYTEQRLVFIDKIQALEITADRYFSIRRVTEKEFQGVVANEL